MLETEGFTCICSPGKYIDIFDIQKHSIDSEYVKIEEIAYLKNIVIEEIDTITKCMNKRWMIIQGVIVQDFNISYDTLAAARKYLLEAFRALLRNLLISSNDKIYREKAISEIKKFSCLVLPMSKFSNEVLSKIARSSMKNSKCPIYMYFHTYLDVHRYLILFAVACESGQESLENHLLSLMKDFVKLSKVLHSSKAESAFVCFCIKNKWFSIQALIAKQCNSTKLFWKMFNQILEKEDPLFSIWLMKELSLLHIPESRDRADVETSPSACENIDFLEIKIKAVIKNDSITSSAISSCLKYAEPLLTKLWLKSSKIEIYQALWEYFSKRLNTQNTDISQYGSVSSFLDLIDSITWCPRDCEIDFHLFIALLLNHLREHQHHWGKMKGRIYSYLSPHKLKDFNEHGIFNTLLLYFCLLNISFDEVNKKIVQVIELLPVEKHQRSIIWIIYMSLLLKYVKENKEISPVSGPMRQMLHSASSEQKDFHLIKLFITGFESMITNSPNMQLQQWSLIGPWLNQYMQRCYYNDLKTVINTILNIIECITKDNAWVEWEPCFKETIYPCLKQVTNSTTPPKSIGKLGAEISLLFPLLAKDAFNFFNSESIAAQVSAEFLSKIMENYPNRCVLSSEQEIIILQSWVKICILTLDEYKQITEHVLKLNILPGFVKSKISPLNDPIISFIEVLETEHVNHITETNKLCEICFGQTDRWITQYFSRPDNEAIVIRLYTTMALTFLHCGSILYDRNKTACPLTRLISALLLPVEFMVGKSLHPFVLNGVKQTWHLFIKAIVKLNRIPDPYLDRLLRDLTVKYLPHFTSADSPFFSILDNEEIAAIVLEKISIAYFNHPPKESEANVVKAFKLASELIKSTTSARMFQLIAKKLLPGIFEVIMFHNQRNTAVSVVNILVSSHLYRTAFKEFDDAVIAVTEKHMAFSTSPYFQLLYTLSKFIKNEIKRLVPRIELHLISVEKRRGVGADKVLRIHFGKLQEILKT